MALEYFSVRNKYYLSGFDWVMGVIDLIMKRTTCAGNASQAVFMLDRPPDEAAFRDALRRFLREFPVVGGRVSRHYTLTPYWKMPKSGVEPPAPLTVTRLGPGQGIIDALTNFINTPFSNKHEHIAFHLIYGKNEQCLAVTFDHRLFDARGAESFVGLFQKFLAAGGKTDISDNVRVTQGFDLSGWKQKFLAGQTVNRRIMALTRERVRAVPVSMNGGRPGFKYRIVSFDEEGAEKIVARAYDEAGYLMIMPYLFSRVAESMHRLFEQRGVTTGAYVVPVSTDLRRAKDIREELFFNHTSMFFFQVRPEDAVDRKKLLSGIKEQLYQQISIKFPEKLMAASSLMRIAPLPVMHLAFHLPLQGKIASYCFSHVSKDALASDHILGSRITNVFHMPRTPVPPGIGVFFNAYAGRLNGTISWLDGQFMDEEMAQVEQDLRCSL